MVTLPSPQQLRYLTALAEHRHFGRAASVCGVTQSTLSAGILTLERQLGLAILDRNRSRHLIFTPAGEAMAVRSIQALSALEAVVDVATASHNSLTSRIRLGIIPTIAPYLLPRLLPAIKHELPHIRLSIAEDITVKLIEKLTAGRLDMLLLALPCHCDGFDTVALGKDPLVVLMPADHPLGQQTEIPIGALHDETLLLLEEGHCLRDQTLAACRDVGVWGPVGNSDHSAATTLQTLVQMVDADLGMALLPQMAVGVEVGKSLGVIIRPVAGAGVSRTIGIVWRSKSSQLSDLAAIIELLRANLELQQQS